MAKQTNNLSQGVDPLIGSFLVSGSETDPLRHEMDEVMCRYLSFADDLAGPWGSDSDESPDMILSAG